MRMMKKAAAHTVDKSAHAPNVAGGDQRQQRHGIQRRTRCVPEPRGGLTENTSVRRHGNLYICIFCVLCVLGLCACVCFVCLGFVHMCALCACLAGQQHGLAGAKDLVERG